MNQAIYCTNTGLSHKYLFNLFVNNVVKRLDVACLFGRSVYGGTLTEMF